MLVVLVVVVVVGLGLVLAVVANRSSARWRVLVRDLIAGLPASQRRPLTWMVASGALTLETPLTPAGITYQAAARMLSCGPLLAILHELGATAGDARLSAKISLARVGAATLRARLKSFLALAAALEALPVAEAMARAFVELSPETALQERRQAFDALLRWHPRAHDVLRICQTLARTRGDDDPTLAAAARAHLAAIV